MASVWCRRSVTARGIDTARVGAGADRAASALPADCLVAPGYRPAMDPDDGYATPEEAALSGWSPSAKARVVMVRAGEEEAFVYVDTVPSHPMRVVCERRSDGRWEWVSDTSE